MPRSLAWTLGAIAMLAAACGGTPRRSAPPGAPVAPAPSVPAAEPPPAPPPVAPAPAPRAQTIALPNGVTALLTTVPAARGATIELALLAGAAFVAPGAAELAAAVLVDGSDPATGRPALRAAIARLGGTLQVHVGPLSTWIDVRVPGERWRDALAALRDALAAPTQSRHQIERIREQHVAARNAEVARDPIAATAQALLLGDKGPADRTLGLLDRDPGEITLFASRLHRPDRALLALAVPADAAAVTAALTGDTGLGTWAPGPAVPGPTTMLQREFASGLYWSPAASGEPAERCRVALVAMLPDPRRPDAAELLLLHACFTLDGAGGRLERLQGDRGLAHVRWQPGIAQTPDATALLLTAEVAPTAVLPLWRTVDRARRSLRDLTPTDSEVATARTRVPLTARLGASDDGARVRLAAMLQLAATDFDAIDRRVAMIAAMRERDLRVAADAYLALPFAMVVLGGSVPADAGPVQSFRLLPTGDAPAAAAPAAAPTGPNAWLEGAADAAGGAHLLRRLRGWTTVAAVVHGDAPAMTESVEWSANGDLQRTRQLLGSTITTTLRGDELTERLGDEVRTLEARDAELLRREARRHPLALLAAHVRGELTFRTIAVRTVGERTVAVVETADAGFERLRMHVDTDSYLVRAVESWDALADGTVVHLHEAWQDHRATLGLRVPFHRVLTQDDGQNRLETRFSQWTPRFR
jgi:hypothetical protein